MNEKFKTLLEKLKKDEYEKELIPILLNTETIRLEASLDQKIDEKYKKCQKFVDNITSLSENGKFEIDLENTDKIKVTSKPVARKEREFKKFLKLFEKCTENFSSLDNVHQKRIVYLNKYSDFSLENCLKQNCEKSFLQGSADLQVKNCIRDCFRFDKINKQAMISLMNEEYLKYIKALDKF